MNSLSFDPDKMTLGDLDDFETATGIEAGPFFDELQERVRADIKNGGEGNVSLPTKAVIGLIWIAKRKDEPTFTFEAARNTSIGELQILASSAPRPTRAARRAAGQRSPAKKKTSARSGAK